MLQELGVAKKFLAEFSRLSESSEYTLGRNSIQFRENSMLSMHVNVMTRYLGSQNDYLNLVL